MLITHSNELNRFKGISFHKTIQISKSKIIRWLIISCDEFDIFVILRQLRLTHFKLCTTFYSQKKILPSRKLKVIGGSEGKESQQITSQQFVKLSKNSSKKKYLKSSKMLDYYRTITWYADVNPWWVLAEAPSQPYETSKIENFHFRKNSTLDVWHSFEYAFEWWTRTKN